MVEPHRHCRAALKIDRNDARVWYSLGIIGGGRVGTERLTKAGCLRKPLKIGPNVAKAWYHLGVLGDGRVGTNNSTQANYYIKALKID